jgi:ubiquinone/menaquinone biosynthesis C-methylase UbiE
MLERIPEPELMDTAEEAQQYDAMDHRAVNTCFVADLLAEAPVDGAWCDLGTGPAHIPILIAEARPGVRVLAVDAALSMLALARRNLKEAGLTERIALVHQDAKFPGLASGSFACVFSNSLVHHLGEPAAFWQTCRRLVAPGGLVFVRDLFRPADRNALDHLVSLHTAGATDCQRRLFAESLVSAFTVEEIAEQAEQAGLVGARVEATSDRHWTLVWRARGR